MSIIDDVRPLIAKYETSEAMTPDERELLIGALYFTHRQALREITKEMDGSESPDGTSLDIATTARYIMHAVSRRLEDIGIGQHVRVNSLLYDALAHDVATVLRSFDHLRSEQLKFLGGELLRMCMLRRFVKTEER